VQYSQVLGDSLDDALQKQWPLMILLSCKSSLKFTNGLIIWVREIEEYLFCVTQFAASPFIEFEATKGYLY
jgi:hypothetical protein